MNFSAADLVKRSAAQIAYFKLTNKVPVVSQEQKLGEQHQEKIVQKLGFAAERKGVYKADSNIIHFCLDVHDEATDTFFEIKKVRNMDTYETWYHNSSLIQSCLYATLLTKVKELSTPLFRLNAGYKQRITFINESIDTIKFILMFGTNTYIVTPNQVVLDFYLEKARVVNTVVSTRQFESAYEFDRKYKHKEWEHFIIKYVAVENEFIQPETETQTKVQW